MKPVKGGRPPKDNNTSGVRDVRVGALAQEVASILMFVALLISKIIKVEQVIIIYVIKVINVKEGENGRINIIHPRCAIDEYARIFRSCV